MLHSFLLYGLLRNLHHLMTLSVSMTSVFFVRASNSPGADYRGRILTFKEPKNR